jgi:hypothetical protein
VRRCTGRRPSPTIGTNLYGNLNQSCKGSSTQSSQHRSSGITLVQSVWSVTLTLPRLEVGNRLVCPVRLAAVPPAIRTDMLSGQQRPSRFKEAENETRALLMHWQRVLRAYTDTRENLHFFTGSNWTTASPDGIESAQDTDTCLSSS